MREIKFRAWDMNVKRMVYHFLLSSSGGLFALENPMTPQGDDYGVFAKIPIYEEAELMQYTGLKDMNGTEMYEGDIVHCPNSPNYGKWAVKWHGHMWNLTPYDPPAHEVIGNIYENSDLLEKRGSL